MRKVIKRRLRHEAGGLNVVADLDAVIAVNRGESGESGAAAAFRHTVVQRLRRRAGATGAAKQPKEEQ